MKTRADYRAEEDFLRRWKIHHRRLLRGDVERIAKALYREPPKWQIVNPDVRFSDGKCRLIIRWRNRDYQSEHMLASVIGRSWFDVAMRLERQIESERTTHREIWGDKPVVV